MPTADGTITKNVNVTDAPGSTVTGSGIDVMAQVVFPAGIADPSVYPSVTFQVRSDVFLNVNVTCTVAPAGTMVGTCCDTNCAVETGLTLGLGVSAPKVPNVCDNMRNRSGDGAEKTHPCGITSKLNVTC